MAKKTKEVKATNPKMVPVSEALDNLTVFCHRVVFGNEAARMVLLDAINTWCDDDDKADDLADVVMALVFQDDEWREHFADNLADNELAMGLLDAAMAIRDVLNLDAYNEYTGKISQILELEEEAKNLLRPKSDNN